MKKKPLIISLLFLIVLIFGLGWIMFLRNAHSTFENYYSFRGCVQLIEKTPDYGTCKISSGQIIKIVKFNNKWYLDGDLPLGAIANTQIEYKNSEYGFSFILPTSWKGYTIVDATWEGSLVDSTSSQKFSGPEILIRHPLWTSENPRQDIPIMIFTYDEWDLIQKEKLSLGAAPIGPSELGRNAKYVFALPARYNFAFPTGFEEVDKIIQSKPLHE